MDKKRKKKPVATPRPSRAGNSAEPIAPRPSAQPPADPPPEPASVTGTTNPAGQPAPPAESQAIGKLEERQAPAPPKVMGRKGEMVHIRYASDETGMAEVLGGGQYRIASIPLTDKLNFDDVVRCRVKDDGELVELVVSRRLKRGYPKKTFVRYERGEQLLRLRQRELAAGAKIEAVGSPQVGQPGLAQVAHGPDFDPLAAAKEVGIKNPRVL
jgi:hypothetical protein